MAPGGERADVDAGVVDVVLHPHPVAEDGAPREWAGRIDGHDRSGGAGTADVFDQPAGQRRLAGAGGPGEPGGPTVTGGSEQRGEHRPPRLSVGLHQGEQPCQRPPVTVPRRGDEICGIRRRRHGVGGYRGAPPDHLPAQLRGRRPLRRRGPGQDALDPGGQGHRRHRAAAAGADELERDLAAVGAEQDQVTAVRLQGRPDVLQGLLQDAEVDVGGPADGVAGVGRRADLDHRGRWGTAYLRAFERVSHGS